MYHSWMLEAETTQELCDKVNRELKAGAQLDGGPMTSGSRKHYQFIRRKVNPLQRLDSRDAGDLERFAIH